MNFSINGVEFAVDEYEYGWAWTTEKAESDRCFDTEAEAQQDAIRYVREQEAFERVDRERDSDERRFGSYDQQVEAEWKAGRL